jgi:hypothetical protein
MNLVDARSQRLLSAPRVKTCLGRHLVTKGRFAGGRRREGPDWRDQVQNQRLKWQAGVIAASGIVT